MVSTDRMNELLRYDPETGEFTWRATRGRMKAGVVAGTVNSHGYRIIRIDNVLYRAHRLVWFYQTGHWPRDEIDHKNCVRDDNRFINLREATRTENLRNSSVRVENRWPKGVYWAKGHRWKASIQVNGKPLYQGGFATPEEAHAAYLSAAKKYFGEFARGA